MKYLKHLASILTLILICSCGNEDYDDLTTDGIISQDSELFDLILRTTSDPELIAEPVRCLQFIFPVTLFQTNTQGSVLSFHILNDNEALFDFLTTLPASNNISISYPITSTAIDGSEVIINSNLDLLAGIEHCIEEEELRREQINLFQGLTRSCEWKVGYSFNSQSNEYLGATLNSVSDITTVTYEDIEVTGTWNFIYDNNVFYSNINFPAADVELQEYFNHNWEIVPSPSESQIILIRDDVELILNKYCTDDMNQCSDFTFTQCEIIDGSRVANYILEEYNDCIYEILRITTPEEQSNYEISYFLDLTSAENNLSPIDASSTFNNSSEEQELFVRLYDIEEDEYSIIPISLITTECI